jgi:hypothetical protein
VVVAAAFTGFLHCQSHDAGNTKLCSDHIQSVMFLCLAKMQPKQLFHTNRILGSVGHEISFVLQYTINPNKLSGVEVSISGVLTESAPPRIWRNACCMLAVFQLSNWPSSLV